MIKNHWASFAELGTRQLFFASRQRQRDNVIELEGQQKLQKMLRFWCLNGVATTKRAIMQVVLTLQWPEIMVTWSRLGSRVPSSDFFLFQKTNAVFSGLIYVV